MASALNEDSVEKKLKTVTNTQDSIQSLSLWIIHHKSHHSKIVELWLKVLKKTVHPSHRLTLFYLCNDVIQTCKKKKAYIYNSTFKEHLKEAAALVRDVSVKGKIERIFNIWEERGVYDGSFVKSLQATLSGTPSKHREHKKKGGKDATKYALMSKLKEDGQPAKNSKKSHGFGFDDPEDNAPISPPGTPFAPYTEKKETPPEAPSQKVERDAEESARILAEFKPHEMIDQMTAFQRQKAEIQVRVSQISHMKLDASYLDSMKHLKDRSHGNDYSNHFEDSCIKLEDLVSRQTQHLQDQQALSDVLNTSEIFYEEQYREARIVANAYKNFGARINNMKKRLDELKKSFPEPDSPIPSPDINAPSPGNTPPHVDNTSFSFNPPRTTDISKNSWLYNGSSSSGSAVGPKRIKDDDSYQDSPPLEAPSPEGSPENLNLGGSETTSASFESRLASFFNQSEPATPPEYTPISSSSKPYKPEDEGGNTPLDDETPTTPVQDEHIKSPSPPKRHSPPKKENPIDFLSRLISQTQKTPTTNSTPSFLDSLSILANVNKPQPLIGSETTRVDLDPSSQPWNSWKSSSEESHTSPNQSSSPVPSYPPPQPISPNQYQPPRTPTMVPPPIPMPVPPPIGMSLSIPPPPPPPFSLTPGVTPDFSSPPPGFQQTSPGQKENWPESGMNQSSDISGEGGTLAGRSIHSSVLKELVPAESFESNPADKMSPLTKAPSPMNEPDLMDIVSEEEDEDLRPNSNGAMGDALNEFAQKLKQKTTSQSSLKSHVFVPNRERPNLMTLAVPDDEKDMLSDNSHTEDSPSWSSKSRKSSHRSKSRSRSRSREKDKRHKKKKKHKHGYSDEEEDKYERQNVESVVTRIDSRSSSSGQDMGDRYGDKYDKYNESDKYDKYNERYRNDHYDNKRYDYEDKDYRKYSYNRNDRVPTGPPTGPPPGPPKDFKDPVQAYTQAYRDAMFQQLNAGRFGSFPPPPPPPPPIDPRRSGFRKY